MKSIKDECRFCSEKMGDNGSKCPKCHTRGNPCGIKHFDKFPGLSFDHILKFNLDMAPLRVMFDYDILLKSFVQPINNDTNTRIVIFKIFVFRKSDELCSGSDDWYVPIYTILNVKFKREISDGLLMDFNLYCNDPKDEKVGTDKVNKINEIDNYTRVIELHKKRLSRLFPKYKTSVKVFANCTDEFSDVDVYESNKEKSKDLDTERADSEDSDVILIGTLGKLKETFPETGIASFAFTINAIVHHEKKEISLRLRIRQIHLGKIENNSLSSDEELSDIVKSFKSKIFESPS
jgi:hypothetical protein